MNIQTGQLAPAFALQDQNGKTHRLAQYKGRWVLVYFYPEDDTPGCTKEACSFRDNLPKFSNSDFTVLGISTDSVESHKKFEEKFNINFTLLADENKEASQTYGVLNEEGRARRTSFLINPEGTIAKIYEKVDPSIHTQQVLEDLQQLNNLAK